ncbi:MAG: hypothetical protein F6J94_12005 [Moorea sp. SIO1F2]|uniref:hypothetical protein n=1 Tax=Moorena sp. SIO1F2 TaxID=2607819 RepID=UPI0013B68940|nr:hypothetical protein [Moorena sp. SIO1F2]NET82627.1 hypothetical protein [Moorena sp. SIO1F2]
MSKKTLAAVVDSGNDYLVKVKRNQPKLYQQIERESNRQTPRQKVTHYEKTRNRKTNRIIEVFEPPENLDPKWIGAGCVIKVSETKPDCCGAFMIGRLCIQGLKLVD